jgi:hypothetical protein
MRLPNVIFVLLMLLTVGAFAEDYTTGNVIDGQWYGTTTTTTQTGGENSHTISSGPTPVYNSVTGEIIFSYSYTTVAQFIGINQVLGDLGTGVALSGYNYSFDYYNQEFNRGLLYFDVYLFGSNGSVLDMLFMQLQHTQNGYTNVSGTQTFASPYDISLLSSLNIYFSGSDDRFWAGYYGPKVKDVNVSLNYTYVYDPCSSDPLYSTSCPGYWDAFVQQLCASGITFLCASQSSVSVAEIEDPLPIQTSQPVQVVEQESSSGEVKVDAGGIEVSASGELSVPDGIPEEVKEKKEVDKNLIASIVREAIDNTETMRVVNQSIEDSLDENSNPSFATSVSLFGDILNDPISELIFTRLSFSVSSVSNNVSEGLEITEETTTQSNNSQATVIADTQSSVTVEQVQETKEEVTVNQNAEPNDAAGGVDIASIAVAPAGFNNYLNKNLTDAKFYEEKEIYKNQQVVDNRRAQRLLSGASDRLHQEMVDEQYKR